MNLFQPPPTLLQGGEVIGASFENDFAFAILDRL
jgi:hypothetical protein